MFKKLLGRLTGGTLPSVLRAADPERWEAELLQRVEERSGEDPLIGAKIGGKELAERMMAMMKTERGVHIESILGALGSLAGYSCQASVRALARSQGLDETALASWSFSVMPLPFTQVAFELKVRRRGVDHRRRTLCRMIRHAKGK